MAAPSPFIQQLWDIATLRRAGQTLIFWARHEEALDRGLATEKPTLVIVLHLFLLDGVEPGSSVGKGVLDLACLGWARSQSCLPKVRGSMGRRKTAFFLASHPGLFREKGLIRHGGRKTARLRTFQGLAPSPP